MRFRKLLRAYRALNNAALRWRDETANVAIISALLLPLLVGTAGFAMDYAYVAYVKQRIDRAAEAAVIGAVSQSAATAVGGYQNLNGLTLEGKGIFSANISQLPIGAVTPNLTVVSDGVNGVVASIDYSTSVNALFSSIVGINSFPIKGTASAKASGTVYINYYIVLDISQSMGIAATASDMTNLFNRVVSYKNGLDSPSQGCVFGCHVKGPTQSFTNEYLAHNVNPPITLRVDSARSAIQSIIAAAQTTSGNNNNIKIGLYTMSKDPVSGQTINTLSSPSSNYPSLTNLAGSIELGNNTSGGLGDSDFSSQLSQFSGIIPTNGSGASALSPLNYVFIVTDGLIDTPGTGCTSGHCTGAFSSSYCTALKTKSTVGVIYTTYLPIYNNNDPNQGYDSNYASLALPFVSQIRPNLQDCVSSSKFFFEASDGPSIVTMMQALFAQSQQSALLTR